MTSLNFHTHVHKFSSLYHIIKITCVCVYRVYMGVLCTCVCGCVYVCVLCLYLKHDLCDQVFTNDYDCYRYSNKAVWTSDKGQVCSIQIHHLYAN